MEHTLHSITGLYKLSEYNLRRLLKRNLKDTKGNPCPGASRNEIAALIYFTQIADHSGFIEEFQTASLEDKICCSKRDTFLIIENLQKKGFITFQAEHWTGYGNIKILHNDYSNVTTYDNKNKYLNTNRLFLKANNSDFYEGFRSLSLYALRMYLWILFSHDSSFGYQISHDAMASFLQIKSRSLIHKYLKEIEPLMFKKECIKETPNEKKRLHYGRFSIPASEHSMFPENGLEAEDDSFYKRKWRRRLEELDIHIQGFRLSSNELLQRLYYIVANALKNRLTLELTENIITLNLRKHCVLNERTLFHIEDKISELIVAPV